MRFLEELDRKHRGQAAEDIEVVPLNDVSYRGGDDHAPEVFRHLWTSHFHSPASRASPLRRVHLPWSSPPLKRPPIVDVHDALYRRRIRCLPGSCSPF